MVHCKPDYFLILDKVNFKLTEQISEVLISNLSNGKLCLLLLIWTFGPESQRGSHPLTCYPHIILWLWRCDFPLVHTINLIRYFQDNLLLPLLYLPVFINIAPSTTCHAQRCKLLFAERLPGGAIMINSWWWCYNF